MFFKKEKLTGFTEFIRQQGIMGLAIGFILGDSVKGVVSALTTDIINPVMGLILGAAGNLQTAVLKVGPVTFLWGHFLSVLIDFTIVAAVVYFIFKGLKLDKLDMPKK